MNSQLTSVMSLSALLLIQPLEGEGGANGSTPAENLLIVEPDIFSFLGRADLLPESEKPPQIPQIPLPLENPAAPQDDSTIPDRAIDPENPNPPQEEALPDNSGDEDVTNPILPPSSGSEKSAGDGPGIVEGVIVDTDGKGIAGVIITLQEQNAYQTTTDDNGKFRITGLPATGVPAEFLKSGFTRKVDVMQVKEAGVTKVEILLELKPVELADGEYLIDSQEVILDLPEEEETGVIGIAADVGPGLAGGGISKEFFSKAAASDAAGAVSKISGANVVGGKFVVVRGLGDRYNNTTLNRGIVPSPETSRRAVQLDLFPSSALQGVAIQKTASPDAPADFVGGIVKLETARGSEEDYLSVSVQTNFDVNTHRNGEFLTVPQLDISSDLRPDNFVPLPTLRTTTSGDAAQAQRQAFFDAISFRPESSDPELDRNISGSFSKTWDIGANSKLNIFGTASYSSQQRFQRTEQSRFQNSIVLTPGFTSADLNPRFADLNSIRQINGLTFFDGLVGNFTQDSYTQSKEFSYLLSGTWDIGKNLQLNGSFFNFRSADSTYTLIDNGITNLADLDIAQADLFARDAVVLDGSDAQFAANSFRQIYDLIYRELEFGQIGGVYKFDDWREGAQISWNAYNSETNETSPRSYELLGFFVQELNNDVDPVSGVTIPNPANFANPTSSSLIQYETSDQSQEFKIDGVLPLFEKTENRKANLFGGFGQYRRERVSDTNAAILASGGGLTDIEDAIAATERLFNDEETGSPNSLAGTAGFVPGSSALGVTENYFGSNEIDSLYLGLDAEWDNWFVLGGFRFEEETRSFLIPNGRRDITLTVVTDDIYPSLDFGHYFGPDKEIKAVFSYSETVVRPTFFEFIPARILDLTNNRVIVGNRDLRETQSQNFDFSLTWKKENNYAGINIFHKIITDPIFTINDPSGTADRTFVNLGETEVSGIELEGSYELGGGFSVTGNVSFLNAEASPGIVTVNNQDFLGQIDQLEGQPDLLGNLILSWENKDAGYSSNLIYNYTGEFLTVASLGFVGQPGSALPNEIRQPFHSLDWNLNKTWSTDLIDYKMKFQVRNILDSDVEIRFEGLSDIVAPSEAFSPGREFSLSLEAKF